MLLRKVCYQRLCVFPPHLSKVSALPGETNPGNCVFLLERWILLCQNKKQIQIMAWLQLKHPLLFLKYLIIPAKASARDYVITGVGLSVCLSVTTITK